MEERESTYFRTDMISSEVGSPSGRHCSGKLAFLFAFGLSYLIAIVAANAGGWSRDIVPLGTQPADQHVFKPFELVLVSGEENHVYGLCVFVNTRPALAAIHGTETPDGEFYPTVLLQVAKREHGKWQTVDSPSTPGKISTLTVEAKRPSKSLRVNLDVFLSMIGKFKYGKIALKTGESAVFKLEKLLPPKEDGEPKSDSAKR